MKRGFTLIELLVVVAIIVILLAVLLPSLSRARELSKNVYCLNVVRMLATASEMYADENNNWYVPVFASSEWYQRASYRQILNVSNDTSIRPYYPRNYICPNATVSLSRPQANNMYSITSSYGMNVSGLTDVRENPLAASSIYGYKRNGIISPASRYMVMDGNDWWLSWYNSNLYVTESPVNSAAGYSMAAAYRHNQSANIAFFDGHAETVHERSINRIYASREKLSMWLPLREFAY